VTKIPNRPSTISRKRRMSDNERKSKPNRRRRGWNDELRERRALQFARWKREPSVNDNPKIISAKQRAMDKGLHGDRGKK